VKSIDLVRHLESHGCGLLREGATIASITIPSHSAPAPCREPRSQEPHRNQNLQAASCARPVALKVTPRNKAKAGGWGPRLYRLDHYIDHWL